MFISSHPIVVVVLINQLKWRCPVGIPTGGQLPSFFAQEL